MRKIAATVRVLLLLAARKLELVPESEATA